MMSTQVSAATLALVVGLGGAGIAQAPRQAEPRAREERADLRHQMYVMEGALARAVEFGARTLNREIRAVMPDVMVLAGRSQARGFYLEGYGVFFDVEVPVLRESMMWSLRTMLDQDQAGVSNALTALRQHVQQETNPATRASLEKAIKRLELQIGPLNQPPARPAPASARAQVGTAAVPPDAVAPSPTSWSASAPADVPLPIDKIWMEDPNKAYTGAVVRALVDAMIDFSAPMAIRSDEWLTVAARDNEQRDTLAPQDPYEEVDTFTLRISGADLAAYRSSQIDRDEARRRVSVNQF